jgi:hypothetical protein
VKPDSMERVSEVFTTRRARREALAGMAGAAAMAMLPGADAEAKKGKGKGKGKGKNQHGSGTQDGKLMFLFLQTSTGGTLVANNDGSFDLTLEGHHGGTIYFSDRPERVFGVSPTEDFLETLGFPKKNPPNAALLVNSGDKEDVAIVELFDPVYDEQTGRLTYRVKLLAAYDETGLDHIAPEIDGSELPEEFDQATLFIDDCSDLSECCKDTWYGGVSCEPLPSGSRPRGKCWSWSTLRCELCFPDASRGWIDACVYQYGNDYNGIR